MTQVSAKVPTANKPGDPSVVLLRSECEKFSERENTTGSGELERSLASTGTSRVMSRFNRQTEALAVLVVSAVVSAALLFAVLVQDRPSKLADLTGQGLLEKQLNNRPFQVP
jgi:hypothetical protein